MTKFSSNDKIQAVKRYEISGEKAFEKRYTSYSFEFKLDVLHSMNEQGTSIRETAALFNIPSCETLRKWKVAYETGGLNALK